MTDVFTWKVLATASGEGEFAVNEARFGDGYSQAVAQGINNEKQTWNVTFHGRKRTGVFGILDPLNFLRARKGSISFFWTPPLGVQGYYRCKRYSIRDEGGGHFTVSATFEQNWQP